MASRWSADEPLRFGRESDNVAVLINCSACGKMTDPRLDNCVHCGAPVRAGAPAARPAPAKPAAKNRCQNCGAPVQGGDIICANCGTNLLTGQKVAQERQAAAAPRRSVKWQPFLLAAGLIVAAALVFGALYFLLSQNALEQARRHLRENRPLDAVASLREHLQEKPDNAEAQRLLGQTLYDLQQFGEAATALRTAQRLTKDTEVGLLAVLALERAPGGPRYADQAAALRDVVESDPGNGRAWYLLGLCYGALDQRDQQVTALNRAVDAGAGAEAQQALGIAQALQGEFAAATTALRAARAGGAGASADAALGAIATLEGTLAAAEAQLNIAASAPEGADEARLLLGLLYLKNGEYESARNQFGPVAAAGGPLAQQALLYESLALQAQGRRPEALVKLEQVAQGGGETAALGAIMLGNLYVDQNEVARAKDLLNQARSAEVPKEMTSTLEGRIVAAEGDDAAARVAYRQAIDLNPDYAPAHLENGLLYIRGGATAEGLSSLERYLSLANREDPRTNEIELLVTQLRQSVQAESGPAASSVRALR